MPEVMWSDCQMQPAEQVAWLNCLTPTSSPGLSGFGPFWAFAISVLGLGSLQQFRGCLLLLWVTQGWYILFLLFFNFVFILFG